MTVRLVVNADDVGLTASVTRSCCESLSRGFITDLSLMAVGEAFDEAVAALYAMERRTCGAHLTLIDSERPMTEPMQRDDGRFDASRTRFLVHLVVSSSRLGHLVAEELDAQLVRIETAGLTVTHVDSHQHLHIFPVLTTRVIDLARRHRVPFVRVPFTSGRGLTAMAVNYFCRRLERACRSAGIRTTTFLGFESSGRMDHRRLTDTLATVAHDGDYELMVHPGHADEHTRYKYGHWNWSWDDEAAVLEQLPAMAERHAIELVSFSDLLG